MRQPTLEEIQYLVKVPIVEYDPSIVWDDAITIACVRADESRRSGLWFICKCPNRYVHRVMNQDKWVKTFYIHGEGIVILDSTELGETNLVKAWLEQVCDINSD